MVLVTFAQYEEAKCQSYAQLAAGFEENVEAIVLATTPPPGTLVGGPWTDEYMAPRPSIPDNIPSKVFVVVGGAEGVQLLLWIKSDGKGDVVLTHTPGPWNAVFLSVGYNLLRWTVVALLLLTVLAGSMRLWNELRELVPQRIRFIVFVFGLVFGMVYAMALTMRIQTFWRKILVDVCQFVLAMCYLTLLLVWIRMLVRLELEKTAKIFTYTTVAGMIATCTALMVNLASTTLVDDAYLDVLTSLANVGVIAVETCIAIIFSIYTYRFLSTRQQANLSTASNHALVQLAILACIGMVTFFLNAITNYVCHLPHMKGRVGPVVADYVLEMLVNTVRVLGLILGIRGPTKTTPSNGTWLTWLSGGLMTKQYLFK